MKEYTITINFSIEANKANYDKICEFAEELTNKIMDDDTLTYHNGIEIVEANVEGVEDHNDYDYDEEKDDIEYFDDEDENY